MPKAVLDHFLHVTENGVYSNDIGFIVHTGLYIYCKVRKKMIQECKNSIAEGSFR